MLTYYEIEAKLDNEVAEYKMGIGKRLGPSPNRIEAACDLPETDVYSCGRCGEAMQSIKLDFEGLCCECSEETAYEREQEKLMRPEDFS